MSSRMYAIVDTNTFSLAVDQGLIDLNLLFDNILETNISTLRYSNDTYQFVIKTNSQESADYLRQRASELNIGYVEYTYEKILQIMSSSEWTTDMSNYLH